MTLLPRWQVLNFCARLAANINPKETHVSSPYQPEELQRVDVDSMTGITALDFGTDWCGFCKAAAPHIEGALVAVDGVRHIKVEDGSGRKLGRSFKVKLWPTVVVMKDGVEMARVVRPHDQAEVAAALAAALQ
jgi:thioredoxin 1